MVYDGKIMTPRSIKQLKNHYHCPHRRQDDGRRKEEGSEEVGQGGNNKLLRKRRTARHVHESL